MSQEVSVSLTQTDNSIDINLEAPALGKIVIDTVKFSPDQRNGTAKRFLGEAALSCYTSSLAEALSARGAKFEEIRGKATVTAGANDKGQSRILGIALDVTVRMDADYEDIFDRVSKVLRNGCLITASLHEAFPVTYNLQLECPDD